MEMPLKVKHARATIIGTFKTGGAHSFWTIALRQPLQVCIDIPFYLNINYNVFYCLGKSHSRMEVLSFIA